MLLIEPSIQAGFKRQLFSSRDPFFLSFVRMMFGGCLQSEREHKS